jgi:hypothetical protein
MGTGSHWLNRWKSPAGTERWDVIIVAPTEMHGIESHVRFSDVEKQWQTKSDDGLEWQYVSLDWLYAWLERCGYHGFRALFDRAVRQRFVRPMMAS